MLRLGVGKSLIRLLVALFVFETSVSPSYAAPILLNSSFGTNCANYVSTSSRYSNRYLTTTNVNISAINILIGTNPSTNFNSSYVYIYSDDPVLNQPAAAIETFTPNVVVGSGGLTALNYVGSRQFSAGSKFWIVTSGTTSSIPQCYYPAANISNLVFAGIVPDTSTTNSNSSFARAYASGTTLNSSTTWISGNSSQIWQLSIEGLPAQVTSSIGLTNGTKNALFRSATTIRATVNANSLVTFYLRNKVIPSCRNVISVGGVADCTWRPSVKGVNQIQAKVVSLDAGYSNTTTTPIEVLVTQRVIRR